MLRAQGEKQAAILRAEGESEAITTVFDAIHRGNPTPTCSPSATSEMLPQIAAGEGSSMWMIPTELTQAMGAMASGFKAPEPVEHAAAPNGAVSPKSPAPGR